MHYFDHEKLHVYQAAKEFLIITETIIKQFPKGRAYLIAQLQRAACSILMKSIHKIHLLFLSMLTNSFRSIILLDSNHENEDGVTAIAIVNRDSHPLKPEVEAYA